MLSANEERQRADFFNRVVDITSKVNSATDDLVSMIERHEGYFTECDVKSMLAMIENVSSMTTKILINAIDAITAGDIYPAGSKGGHDYSVNTMQENYTPDMSSKLPEVVTEIISIIGFNSAMKLVKTFGGTTLPIGKGIRFLGGKNASKLRDLLSEEEVKKLHWYFSGSVLYVPRCDYILREVRNAAFLKEFSSMREAGVSSLECMRELPPKYGFTDRYGWQLLKKAKGSAQNKQNLN
ncbi:hypothetical protein NLN82_23410 [Citrobacter portucalensis]|uniref:hypothetical protein n=1 Tax=Citrobacter portucalensis TaxID=1639133 RepID=UPI00226B0617|nr:hypothetical protein [Citrobacter portucalensis]MCX9038977.1 hypothetical protein [Citrobacter portucalensis]